MTRSAPSDAVLVGHDWGAAIVYRAAALAPERVRALCAVAITHPSLIKPRPGLLWGARHFVTLSLPTGERLARGRDFAYIDTLMRRWAPRWSGPARDATLAPTSSGRSPIRSCSMRALSYYRRQRRGGLATSQAARRSSSAARRDILGEEDFRGSPQAFEALVRGR